MSTAGTGRFVLPVVLSATFVQLLNVTIAQVAAPSIQADLGAGSGALQLVLAGYSLTYACLLITVARLGDRYGYHRLFTVGTVVFTAGSIAGAFAPDTAALIAARLVQGAGSGLVAPQVLSIIQVALPAGRRAHALGLYGAIMGVASLAGPLFGGVLVDADVLGLGWRPVFLISVPVTLASLVGAKALPHVRGRGDSGHIDNAGALLATVGFGALVLPLALGRDTGWPWWTWLSFAVSALCLGSFARTLTHSRTPLINPEVFRDQKARAGVVLVFVFNAGVPSFTYLLLLHLQSALGYTPFSAASMSAPYAAAAVIGSTVAPTLSTRFGTRLLTVSSLVLACMALALGPVIAAGGRWLAVPLLAVGGAAFGAFTACVFAVVASKARPETASSVSGLLPTAQQLGGTLGLTVAGMVYFAPSASSDTAFGHAMVFEAVVFGAGALLSLRLRERDRFATTQCSRVRTRRS